MPEQEEGKRPADQPQSAGLQQDSSNSSRIWKDPHDKSKWSQPTFGVPGYIDDEDDDERRAFFGFSSSP